MNCFKRYCFLHNGGSAPLWRLKLCSGCGAKINCPTKPIYFYLFKILHYLLYTSETRSLLVRKRFLPPVGRVILRHSIAVAGERSIRKQRLELREHVREDEGELDEAPSTWRLLVKHLLPALLEQVDALLTLAREVVHEDDKVLVGSESRHSIVVNWLDQLELKIDEIKHKSAIRYGTECCGTESFVNISAKVSASKIESFQNVATIFKIAAKIVIS